MEMSGQKITQMTVIAIVTLILVYDVFAYAIWGVDATISRVTLAWSRQWPVIPFGTGVVCGHLYWPQISKDDKNIK